MADITQETPVPPEPDPDTQPDGPIDAPPPEQDDVDPGALGGGTGGVTGEPSEPGQSAI